MYIRLRVYISIYVSADPGLSQGRGGTWDHRRCGTHPSLWLSSNHKTFPSTFQKPLGPWPLSAKLWHSLRPQLLRRSKVPFSRPQVLKTCPGSFQGQLGPWPSSALSHLQSLGACSGHNLCVLRRSKVPFGRSCGESFRFARANPLVPF